MLQNMKLLITRDSEMQVFLSCDLNKRDRFIKTNNPEIIDNKTSK